MSGTEMADVPHILLGEPYVLEVHAPDFVREKTGNLARTEDCRFSPNGKKLAMAGFAKNAIVIFDVELNSGDGAPQLSLTDYVELTSEVLNHPHGLDFVDDETLVIGNRGGSVVVFQVPDPTPDQKQIVLPPLLTITKADFFNKLNSPGSVCVTDSGPDSYEILVCNNYNHRVTQHCVSRGAGHRVTSNRILLENRLKIPDGVAQSENRHLFAISNHLTHEVFIYRTEAKNGRRTLPHGVLKGVDFPHGLRFFGDDRYILVADAGLPFSRLYFCADGKWEGEYRPIRSIRVMPDETFLKGRSNPQEGGLKGLDFSPCGQILATTCEMQPLVFYDAEKLLKAAAG